MQILRLAKMGDMLVEVLVHKLVESKLNRVTATMTQLGQTSKDQGQHVTIKTMVDDIDQLKPGLKAVAVTE